MVLIPLPGALDKSYALNLFPIRRPFDLALLCQFLHLEVCNNIGIFTETQMVQIIGLVGPESGSLNDRTNSQTRLVTILLHENIKRAIGSTLLPAYAQVLLSIADKKVYELVDSVCMICDCMEHGTPALFQ